MIFEPVRLHLQTNERQSYRGLILETLRLYKNRKSDEIGIIS